MARSIPVGPAIIGAAILIAASIVAAGSPGPAAPAAGTQDAIAGGTDAASPVPAAPTLVTYVGSVAIEPVRGEVGTAITMTGTGFASHVDLDIVWNSVRGSWVLKGEANEEFHGREFEAVASRLTTTRTDATGRFTALFDAPLDYGFSHDATVERDGTLLNKAAFRLDPTVSVEPRSGPPGTPITIRMEGVGWANLENSWLVTYDNQFTGLLSAVTTKGVATAVIPATGGPGEHLIRVVHGSFTVPYLNMEQSPRPDRPTFTIPFRVTPGPAVLPPNPASQGLAPRAGTPSTASGPVIWTDPASASVGTPVVIHGRGFAPSGEVSLTWTTVTGNRVGGSGWDEQATELTRLQARSDGTFVHALPVPDDLGGPHRIDATVDAATVATTELTITPSAVEFSPARGPVGTEIVINLKGVGWTETANIYHLVYDNGYLGYACGFNSQGDVVIRLPATGTPGWHFIDLYPGIYKGKDVPGVQNFRIPQLTYEADHPGEDLPAFRFAFEVTP